MSKEFNGFINVKYIKFNDNKEPVDGKNTYDIDEISDWHQCWGILIPDDIVVIDSDNIEEGSKLVDIIKDKRINCYISKTDKGYHFYFRIPKGMKIKNGVDIPTPLGLVDIDYRSGQQWSLAFEFMHGKWREWVIGPKYNEQKEGFILDPYDLDELPHWLYPLPKNSSVIPLIGMVEGDGRDDSLYRLSWTLINKGFNQKQVEETFKLINVYIFEDPLDDKQLTKLFTFDEKQSKSADQRWFTEINGKIQFDHSEMARFMSQVLFAYRDSMSNIWFYDGKKYGVDDFILEQKIAEHCPSLKIAQRKEVMESLKLLNKSFHSTIVPQINHNYLCCENGLVDGTTGYLTNFNPGYFVTTQLNVTYNANAYDQHVDKFLDEVLVEKGDNEQRKIFEEYLGYTLFGKTNFMKKMLFMIGPSADNGKSTTLQMLQALLTMDNYSTVKLQELNAGKGRFNMAELDNKLANIDDDVANISLKGDNMSYLKTIISENSIVTVDKKFKQPYKTLIRAKMWAASNFILKTEQKGDEWMTRLIILAFENQFKGEAKDPTLLDKLVTPSAQSYLLRLAVVGYQRLWKNKEFTKSPTMDKWMKQYRMENDSVYKFLDYKKYDVATLNGKTVQAVYIEYKNYMTSIDEIMFKQNIDRMSRRILEWFGDKLKIDIENNERIFKAVQ